MSPFCHNFTSVLELLSVCCSYRLHENDDDNYDDDQESLLDILRPATEHRKCSDNEVREQIINDHNSAIDVKNDHDNNFHLARNCH